MITQITIFGRTDYNPNYPPKDAKKGYVAKITGKAAGAVKYEREFLGVEATLLEGDEGLYERQRGDKNGGFTRWYHVMLNHPEHGLMLSMDCEDEVPKIAKLLDAGHSIENIIEIHDIQPSEANEGRMKFKAVARNLADVKKVTKSATVESAIKSCWEILSLLPEKEVKKVLTQLRKKVSESVPS